MKVSEPKVFEGFRTKVFAKFSEPMVFSKVSEPMAFVKVSEAMVFVKVSEAKVFEEGVLLNGMKVGVRNLCLASQAFLGMPVTLLFPIVGKTQPAQHA